MKAEFMVVGIGQGGDSAPMGERNEWVVLHLRREVAHMRETQGPSEKVEQMLQAVEASVGTTDDDRRQAKSMIRATLKPMYEMMVPRGQPNYLYADVAITEEEYVALYRPAYGDRVVLEVVTVSRGQQGVAVTVATAPVEGHVARKLRNPRNARRRT